MPNPVFIPPTVPITNGCPQVERAIVGVLELGRELLPHVNLRFGRHWRTSGACSEAT
jgi:hypothetical protein